MPLSAYTLYSFLAPCSHFATGTFFVTKTDYSGGNSMIQSRKMAAWLILTPIFASTLFAFNNCAAPSNEMAASSSSTPYRTPNNNGGSTTPTNPGDTNFKVNDTLSQAQLAKVSSSLASFYEAYAASPTVKGMAVTWDGQGIVGVFGFEQSQDGLASHVISLCNARYQKKCHLLAAGDKFQISYSDFQEGKNNQGLNAENTDVMKGQAISASSFPMMRGHKVISDYIANTNLKAMAVSWAGGLVWQYSSTAARTQEEMSRMTLESCQVMTKRKCTLLAEGNYYAWDWQTSKMVWSLPAAGQDLKLAEIPMVSDKYRADAQASVYQQYVSGGGHGAIYLVQGGGATLRASAAGAETVDQVKATVLKTCQDTYPGKECLLYAVDNKIVWDMAERK